MKSWPGNAALVMLIIGLMTTAPVKAETQGYGGSAMGAVLARDSSQSDAISVTKSSYGTGFVFSLDVGARFDWGGRLEGELAWRRAPVTLLVTTAPGRSEATDIATTLWGVNGMVNYWQELFLGKALTPYVGGGVGVAWVTVSDSAFDAYGRNNSAGFAWQVGGGLLFKVGRQYALDFGYRYFGVSGLEFGQRQRGDTSLGIHTFTLGFQRWFQ
jgi:opacity protein-like surface antigen